MNLAVVSVAALALAVLVSCISRLNVGVLAVALAWIVGVYLGGMPVNTVMGGFPSQLFLTLTGVTLLFALAQTNGTLDRLTHHAVRVCRGNCGAIPVMFFALGAALASMGPGNIATAALVAPIAMSTAARTGIPLFLMAIMVGNGANAGALSPFAPTGIIVNGLMARNGLPGLELPTYLYNLSAHAAVAFGGYFLFGGLRLFANGRTSEVDVEAPAHPGAFELRHWITLAVIASLIVSVIFAQVNVGMGAFLGAVVLVLTRSADDSEAIKRMPWRVIVMVCGVTVLIALVERAQGIDLMVSLVARVASPETVTAVRFSPASCRSIAARRASCCRPFCRWCRAWQNSCRARARWRSRRR
jgi:Na+/H+ antiporter NhaD/arsenite permease-like protein